MRGNNCYTFLRNFTQLGHPELEIRDDYHVEASVGVLDGKLPLLVLTNPVVYVRNRESLAFPRRRFLCFVAALVARHPPTLHPPNHIAHCKLGLRCLLA